MGLALGGSHGIFTNPGKFIGHELSLKQIVPNFLSAAGAAVGTLIAPGIGTAFGAGLGSYAGNELEGETGNKALSTALQTGALAGGAYGALDAGGLVGAGAGATGAADAGAAAGATADASTTGGTLLGNGINALASDVGLTGAGGGSLIGNAVNALGADVGIGGASAADAASGGGGTLLGNAVDSLGSDVGLGPTNLLGTGINNLGADIGIGGGQTGLAAPAQVGQLGAGPSTASLIAHTAAGFNGPVVASVDPALAAAPAAAAGGSTAAGGLFSGGLASDLKLGLGATALGLDVLRGNQPVKGQNQINADAALLQQQGITNQNYLENGTLPPGAQAAINQAVTAAQAAIRSQYAARGMSGSSAEAQDLQNAATSGVTQATNMAMQLYQQGTQEIGMSSQLYGQIMSTALSQDQSLSQGIGLLSYYLAGGQQAPAANSNAPSGGTTDALAA